tara:strand:+ start:31104 stop:31349 length:246 start_codon:yes stop_codon:yes gene_type:complete
MNQSDKDFQAWIESCPDILKFRLEYIDVRADIENVIQSYEYEFASEQTKQEVIEQVIEDFYDQDWADHNEFISYLLDRRLA